MRRLVILLATPAGRILRYLVSLSLLAALAYQINWAQLSGMRGQFSFPLTMSAFLIAGATYPLHAWRWLLLLRAQGLTLPFRWAHVVTWIGQFYNAFLLGGVGGDAARVFYLLRDASTQRAGGFVTLAMDRAMGLVVLMAIATLALAARTSTITTDPRLRWLFITALTITLGGAVVALLLLRLDPARWPSPVRQALGSARLETASQILRCVRAAPRAHFFAFAISAAIWLLDFIAAWLLARAVGLPLPFLETCVAMSVAYASTALPISVGGHGVREGALIATLTAFGLLATSVAQDRALLLAFLVWATTVFWSLVGGMVLLFSPRLLKPTILATAA